MPTTTLFNLEWLNHNSQRSYPLAESATKTDQSGTFKIPDSLLLALYLPVSAGVSVEPDKFFVRRVTVFGTGVNVTVAYNDGTNSPPSVASAALAFDGHVEYRAYPLPGAGDFDDSLGKVVFGKLDELETLPPGEYTFDYAAGKLDPDCVRPTLRGVTSVVLVNGNDRSEKLTGILELTAGTNTKLSVVSGGATTVIRIDAIKGEGLTKECVCEDSAELYPCIKTINGIPPTANGDFTVLGDECLTVDGIVNGIRFNDQCSKPCCGCTELEAVTRDLERFGEAATSLQNFLNRLEGSVNRMNLTVLGSRLNDKGCRTCEEPESEAP